MAFSPDGRLLAANTLTGMVLWDPSTGEEVAHLSDSSSFPVFSPDSKLLVAKVGLEEGQITLWDTATLKPVGRLNVDGLPEAFSPDGSRLATDTSLYQIGHEGISLWDVDTRTRLASTRAPSGFWSIAFSPDGQKLIMYGFGFPDRSGENLYLWDANNLEPLGSLAGPQASRIEAFFLPDGRVLACYWTDYLNSPDHIGIWTMELP